MADDVIARLDELASIAAFVASVPSGGHALLLAGDAGIGKTELWLAGRRLAADQGLRVLESRSSPSETQIAFASIGDLFTPVVDGALPLLPGVQRQALESALLLRESQGPPPDARVLGVSLVSVVRMLARDGPVLLAVDDAQWVDASSAAVLRFLVRRISDQPVGVLATVRGRPVEAPFELERAFTDFRRLTVPPLSVGAIHAVLWRRLELVLPRPTLVRVHAASGGNPFFALELGRGIADGSIRADADEVSLPDSLRAVVEQRLGALPPSLRPTLVAVAALSAPSVTLLAPLGGTTLDDLDAAAAQDVITFDGDRVRFTHPLLAPACYALLPQHQRRRVHRRLAVLDVDPEEKARHLALAATGADEEIARALDAAALRARDRGAAQAAAELAERAIALTPAAASEDVARRRIVAARLCVDAGDVGRARSLLEESAESTPAGPARVEELMVLAEVRGQSEGHLAATDVLQRALAEPGIDQHQEATILGSLAQKASFDGQSALAADHAEAALALAEDLGDSSLLVASLTVYADVTFWRTGRLCLDLLDRAIALHRQSHGGPGDDPRGTLAQNLGRAERYAESRELWTTLIAESHAREDPDVAVQLFFLARMEVGAGHWDRVADLCTEAVDLARQTGREVVAPLCQMVLTEVAAYRGEADPDALPGLVRESQSFGYGGARHRLQRAFASFALARNDPRAAWSQVEPCFEGIGELDEVVAQLAGSVGVEALVGAGELAAAEQLLAKLDHRAATAETALPSLARRCRGLILEARGDLVAALAELEAAAVLPEPPAGRNPLEQGRTLLALGRVHRELQHKKAARETLDQAREIFDRLGARPWTEKTSQEIRRIGGRTASRDTLSETERRIVELVVAGRRNREVADELFLSPDTVAWNLSRVYRKLGVTSRTQLAVKVADSRLKHAQGDLASGNGDREG